MLLDELVKESFDLDYEIIYKQRDLDIIDQQINSAKSKEIKDLLSDVKTKIQNLEGLLQNCDNQRKVK